MLFDSMNLLSSWLYHVAKIPPGDVEIHIHSIRPDVKDSVLRALIKEAGEHLTKEAVLKGKIEIYGITVRLQ